MLIITYGCFLIQVRDKLKASIEREMQLEELYENSNRNVSFNIGVHSLKKFFIYIYFYSFKNVFFNKLFFIFCTNIQK